MHWHHNSPDDLQCPYYGERNGIERMLGHLKSNRAVDDVASILPDDIGGWLGIEWRSFTNVRL
jgi:hypothetical protein